MFIAIGLSWAWSIDARRGANEYQLELSANGLYSFGYAFRNNEIDYFEFYATLPHLPAAQTVAMPRIVSATAPKNVVIITLESMSSSYMAYGGNTQNLTPRLDRLATQGLMLGYLTTNQLVVLRPGRKIEDWRLNAQMEIVAPVRQPDPVVSRAIGAYQETARRARDGRLQHVNLSDGLRMR